MALIALVIEDVRVNMTNEKRSKASLHKLAAKAYGVLEKRRIPLWSMKDVTGSVIDGRSDVARKLLIEEHGFSRSQADTLMAYIDPGIKGYDVKLEEISFEDIHFPTDEECEEFDERLLSFSVQYIARRGLIIGEAITSTWTDRHGMAVNRVFFDKQMLLPSQLQQVWRVFPKQETDT